MSPVMTSEPNKVQVVLINLQTQSPIRIGLNTPKVH